MFERLQFRFICKLAFCGLVASVCQANTQLKPEFFPDLEQHSDESIRLRGIAQLYPNSILFEDPALETRSLREEAASIETLQREITYVRVYRLEEAITAIKEVVDSPALILDMRYLRSTSAGMELARLLNSGENTASVTAVGKVSITLKQAKADLEVSKRAHPAIVLCNRDTAGPFEAILHSLQANNCIIAVGEPTSGHTGTYSTLDEETWIIQGEVRPSPEHSLLSTGFVPRIEIAATPEKNYISYHLYEAGTPIARLLRNDSKKSSHPSNNSNSTDSEQTEAEEPDAVLQRGVDIVAALQILQQLPEN